MSVVVEESVDVVRGYLQRGLGYHRHLHVYEPDTGSGQYTAVCGRVDEPVVSDELASIHPASFLIRSDACGLCSRIIGEAETNRSISGVEFDPFNVFDYGARDNDFPELPEEPDEYVCPDCGKSYSPRGIGQHWGHPKTDCVYPVPSERQQGILTGLWLSGGSIEQRGSFPILRKTSVRKYPLDWLNSELGLWGVDVSKSSSRKRQQDSVESGFGDADVGSHQPYRLTTRTCPFLEDLLEMDVSDVVLTPRMGQILYSFRGYVIDKSAISFRHEAGTELVEVLQNAGFTEVSLYEPDDGKNQWKLALSAEDSRRFSVWIGEEPLPGVTQRCKQLEFRTRGVQGQRPSRRVPLSTTVREE